MDLIKETYDILNHHLGTEHRGNKRLPPEQEGLHKDLTALISYAIKVGKTIGAKEVLLEVKAKSQIITDSANDILSKLLEEMKNQKVVSRAQQSEEKL